MEDTRVICPSLGISWGNTRGHSSEKTSQSLQTITANFPFRYNLYNQSGSRGNRLSFDALMGCFLSDGSSHFSEVSLMPFCSYNIDFCFLSPVKTPVSWKTHDGFLTITTLNATRTDTQALSGSLHARCVIGGRPAASKAIDPRGIATRSRCRLCHAGMGGVMYCFF